MKTENNYLESQNTLLRHSLKKWNPDSITASLNPRLPSFAKGFGRARRGNDREKHLTKNLQPTTYNPQLRLIGGQANSGFVMLFSVLIASLLVAVGLSIFNITLKELTISTAARESQTAFYAANAGLECALYWDLVGDGSNQSAFPANTSDISNATAVPAKCNNFNNLNININDINGITSGPNTATTIFQFDIVDPTTVPNPPCADVKVKKDSLTGKVTIESQGTNICSGAGRRVQRGLQATYTR